MQQKQHTDKSEFEPDSQSLHVRLDGFKQPIALILLTISLLSVPACAQSPVGETAQEPVAVDAAPAWVERRDLSIEQGSLSRLRARFSSNSLAASPLRATPESVRATPICSTRCAIRCNRAENEDMMTAGLSWSYRVYLPTMSRVVSRVNYTGSNCPCGMITNYGRMVSFPIGSP